MYSPRWLFLYPGAALLVLGVVGAAILFPGPVKLEGISFDVHSLIVACIAIIVGLQSISFSLIARKFATSQGLMPPSERFAGLLDAFTLERLLIGGIGFVMTLPPVSIQP
ncbi:MAG: hypothetical protein O9344_17580 [Phreatobacter sp.]|nr:hypothetical protein [Phreatobacter sp.]